jgi:hypothetical protein
MAGANTGSMSGITPPVMAIAAAKNKEAKAGLRWEKLAVLNFSENFISVSRRKL